MYHVFQHQNLLLPSEWICMFCVIMRIDSNYLPKHHQPTGLSNGSIVFCAVRTEFVSINCMTYVSLIDFSACFSFPSNINIEIWILFSVWNFNIKIPSQCSCTVPLFYFLLKQSAFHHFTFSLNSQPTCHLEPFPEGRANTAWKRSEL